MQYYSIAIDGPAGSGKSTIAKSVARGLGFTYIDTGAMYRAITLKALELNIPNLADESLYTFINDTKLEFIDEKMHMDGRDVSEEIRTEPVVKNVSLVSSLKYVRDILVEKQREMARGTSVVMDGRDIGTNVLVNADLKIFLTAAIDVRALRRFYEQQENGSSMTYDDVVVDLIRRDNFDTNRLNNPLRKAEDAIEIDNSELTIEETAQKIMHLFKRAKLVMANQKIGAFVRGAEVVLVKDNEAFISVGDKGEGVIHLDHFTTDKSIQSLKDVLHVGDKIDVEIAGRTPSGTALLSRLGIEEREKRRKIERKIMNRHPFEATVKRVTEDGLILEKDGVRLFCPNNYIDLNPEFDKNTLLNTDTRVVFAKSEQDEKGRTTFIVSRKQVQYNEERKAREADFERIQVGDELEGPVTKLTEFGAFVSLGHVEGLVHLTEISHYRIKNPAEALNVGDIVKVKVLKKTETKIQLSIKALQKTPWELFLENHKVGDVVEGRIVKKGERFMLLEVEKEVVGILNSADYSWKKDDNFAGTVEEGDMVKVQITYIDKDKERMTLSKKHLEYNPWQDANFKYGDEVTGTIERFNNTGAVVKVGNVEALLNNRDASTSGKPANEVFKEGDVIKARVVKVDPERWYLQLSVRSIEESKEREYVDKYINENVSSSISIEDALKEKGQE